jgi:glucose uptake protein GlcU
MATTAPFLHGTASAMGSCDACGWAGAFMSMLGFGSFGAPIKSDAAKSVDIDPLVFQSYKTFMCFVTSWLVLAFGEPFSYTPWGIVSACFWVPGGVAAIAAIKMTGLAVAMGTLSSFIVLVSFVWGIFVFEERIHSRGIACIAILLMMMGLCGMSYYSSLETENCHDHNNTAADYQPLTDEEEAPPEETNPNNLQTPEPETNTSNTHTGTTTEPLIESSTATNTNTEEPSSPPDTVLILGRHLPRRKVGIACAVFCGSWGGSIMAPEKLAGQHNSGIGYLISFSIGAAIVTIFLWMVRFGYHWMRLGSAQDAYQALPSFHVRVMWLPGCTAGALWSMGNFFSLISVKYLGEGHGYSVTQSAMLGEYSIDGCLLDT